MKKFLTLLPAILIAVATLFGEKAKAQPACVAAFTYSIGNTTPNGTLVSFFDSSWTAGTITNWQWSFGNGTGSSQQNPLTAFTPGYHYVCLTITAIVQNQTCTSSWCDTIYIQGGGLPCNSNFTFTNNVLGVQFSASGTNNVSWFWDFGDSTTSTQANPIHSFPGPGTYTVCLTVTDGNGQSCTSCANVTISGGGSNCAASFTYFVDSLGTVWFNNTSTGGGAGVSYSWNFGNGQTSNQANPSYSYNSPGVYLACLTMYDSLQSCFSTYCDSILVTNPGSGCQSNFSYQLSPSGAVFFSGLMANNTSWAWSFGDGSAGTGANVSHTYAPGTYTVCLTVTNSNGLTCTSCQTITIQMSLLCSSNFVIYPDSNLAHTYIAVNLASGVAPITYVWSWGDGTSSTGAYPSHTYSAPGVYTICLSITDANGCTSSTCNPYQLYRLSSGVPVTINVIAAGSTGLQEPVFAGDVTVFPVPASSFVEVNLSLNAATTVELQLKNLSGQAVYRLDAGLVEAGDQHFTVDMSKLPAGLYFLETNAGGAFKYTKVVKQ